MKRLIFGAAAATLLAGPVFAQATQTDTAALTGTANEICVLPDPTSSVPGAYNNGTSTVDFSQFISTTTALMTSGVVVLTYANAYCNDPHNISIDSAQGGLVNATPETILGGSQTFIQKIGYTAAVTGWSTNPASLAFASSTASAAATTPAPTTAVIAGAYRGDLVLTLTLDGASASASPVARGTFTDTFVVQIGATI